MLADERSSPLHAPPRPSPLPPQVLPLHTTVLISFIPSFYGATCEAPNGFFHPPENKVFTKKDFEKSRSRWHYLCRCSSNRDPQRLPFNMYG